MGSDCYKVEVLHYLNPHLIWVEVTDPAIKRDGFTFEQVGIYGVLPLEMTIDTLENKLDSGRSETWMPAAATFIQNALSGATDVFFCPTHIYRRSSIFDDNIHKFGELIIKRASGKEKRLSKWLVKSGLAVYDECLFYQELRLGNLKTKLNNAKTSEVVTHLEKFYKKRDGQKKQWEKSVQKQTTIFHAAHQLESLTVENLEALNKHQKQKYTNVNDFLQRKFRDLEMCKDIDEEPLGRGNQKEKMKFKDLDLNVEEQSLGRHIHKEKKTELTRSILSRKLKLIEESQKKEAIVNKSPKAVLDYMKGFLLKNAVNKKASISDKTQEKAKDAVFETIDDKNNTVQKEGNIPITIREVFNEPDTEVQYSKDVLNNNAIKKEANISSKTKEIFAPKKHEADRTISKTPEKEYDNACIPEYVPQRSHCKKATKSQRNHNIIPEYDIHKEKRIAYGPPEFNRSKLLQKVISLNQPEEPLTATEVVKDERIGIRDKKEDFYGDVDSDIEIEIPRKETLRTLETPKKLEPHEKQVRNQGKKLKESISPEKSRLQENTSPSSSVLKRKLRLYKESQLKSNESTLSSISDTSNKDTSTSNEEVTQKKAVRKQTELDSDDESMSEIMEKLNLEYPPEVSSRKEAPHEVTYTNYVQVRNHANPFKNVDPNISGFVERLVAPVMMVHSKKDNRIQPICDCRDINFNTHIQIVLKNMGIEKPMTLQKVSWLTILRGYSLFMISPKGSGKTMGYLPAVCRLVTDYSEQMKDIGPICVIICGTASSVSDVEKLSRIFLGSKMKVLACYAGMNELDLTTSLLNGCDLLISTPSIFVRLLKSTDFYLNLQRLTSFVVDDCERISEIYGNEIQYFFLKIKEMLKQRVQKELKVQYVLASRVWCNFMEPLAKKAPDTVISIGAFQECVLYAKANTTACFVTKENKTRYVLEFLNEIDNSKKTVIVCREDKEVEMLEQTLKKRGYVVFACNNTMTVQDLYKLSSQWNDYEEPITGPILVCCDGNLVQMNVTDAHYLFHYSLPHLFSMFCKRFAVLNENYPSIFKTTNESIKIKILLENSNLEQLPKIMHFIKRCTNEVPKVLDDVSERVLAEKDALKANNLVPLCNNLLALGKCPDFWNCQERHTVFRECDEPKDWVPKSGVVTFRILYYHSAILYSARLLSSTVSGQTTNFPQTHNMLTMKIAKYFGSESNKRLHGVPEVGDICAVSIKQHFFVRCQVVKILSLYQKGNPNHVLIRLIDEERLEQSRDIYLYHLPEEMKMPNTFVVQVRLANIQPRDKDITFSELAKNKLMKITEKNDELHLRGEIALTVGNCLIVSNIETCVVLESINNTVFRHDFRQELEAHATSNPEHIPALRKLCEDGGVSIKQETEVEVQKPIKGLPEGRWAHLEKDDLSPIYRASVENPATFFVRLVKFQDCANILVKDIQKYIDQKPESLTDIKKGDIVIAEFPDDNMYERARIDEILEANKVKCFFVDQGDWREVSKKNLAPITEKLINQLPFQAIECRLIGVQPHGEEWTDFSTNWFNSSLEDHTGDLKQLFVKYFTKEEAQYTRGHKYGVAIIDTNTEEDILLNKLMIEANLAREVEEEIVYFNELDLAKTVKSCDIQSSDNEDDWEKISRGTVASEIDTYGSPNSPAVPLENIFPKKPIRSVSLVDSDFDSDDMDINITDDFMDLFKPMEKNSKINLPALKSVDSQKTKAQSDSDVSAQSSSTNDIQIVSSPQKIKLLDSDDLTSPDTTKLSENLDKKNASLIETDHNRKPKLCWRQNATNVFIKILLIGLENYDLKIGEKHLYFNGTVNDTNYAFDFELYGVVDDKKSTHANKGQYILVNLKKILKRNWLALAKEYNKKWIVYDVDHIGDSSEEESFYDTSAEAIRNMHKSDTDSDDDFVDDLDYRYKRH